MHLYLCCALRCPVSRGCGTQVLTWVTERRGGRRETSFSTPRATHPHTVWPRLLRYGEVWSKRAHALLTHLENGEKEPLAFIPPTEWQDRGTEVWTSLEPGPASWPALWELLTLAEDPALIPGSGGHVRACPQVAVRVGQSASLQSVPEARRHGPQGYKVRQPTSLTSW